MKEAEKEPDDTIRSHAAEQMPITEATLQLHAGVEGDSSRTAEEISGIPEEELQREHARGLGYFVYLTMFSIPPAEVINDLYESHRDKAIILDDEQEWLIDWPANVYLDAYSARYGMNSLLIKHLCETASRELAGKVLQSIEDKRGAHATAWDAPIWELREQLHGSPTPGKRLDRLAAVAEVVHQQGLAALRDDHFTVLGKAKDFGIDLGVPFLR